MYAVIPSITIIFITHININILIIVFFNV